RERNDPEEAPDQEVDDAIVLKQEARDQEARKGEEERHPHRSGHLVEAPALGAERQQVRAEDEQDADPAPAVEDGETVVAVSHGDDRAARAPTRACRGAVTARRAAAWRGCRAERRSAL